MIARNSGFTLIELMVAIFIFSIITIGIVSVFVSTAGSYQKSRAIKEVKENVEYSISSIAKDVRMGKIEATDSNCIGNGGSPKACLMVTRNRGGKVCYRVAGNYLGIQESVSGNTCSLNAADYKKIIDLSGGSTTFDVSTSGFYSCPSAVEIPALCGGVTEKRRGWVEINLNILPNAGKEMEADQINVQTVVSSRDYGWEDMEP
jgi:prepilin-type N-terminal cleavage/methylation domain-containing protein